MQDLDVTVIGAGIAGLVAADRLRERGLTVQVVEADAEVGGRTATVRHGDAVFDAGAQFLTAKAARFQARVDGWRDGDLVTTWFHGAPDPGHLGEDGYPRYRGVPDQGAISAHLARELGAAGVDIRCGRAVERVRTEGARWWVTLADGTHLTSRSLLSSAPAPLTLALLDGGPAGLRGTLREVTYDPTIAALIRLDGPVDIGNAGALRLAGEPLAWLGDNHAKGVSPVPALTVHAGPEASASWWVEPADEVGRRLLGAAAQVVEGLTGEVIAVRRWRFAQPTSDPVEGGALVTSTPLPLAVAGDGLNGGRVEGAALSGEAAADGLADLLS